MKQETKDKICAAVGVVCACGVTYTGMYSSTFLSLTHRLVPNPVIGAAGEMIVTMAGQALSLTAGAETYRRMSNFTAACLDSEEEWKKSKFYMNKVEY